MNELRRTRPGERSPRRTWARLVALVLPIGLFWFLIYLGLFPGTKGPNHFGPDPREQRNSDQRQTTGAT